VDYSVIEFSDQTYSVVKKIGTQNKKGAENLTPGESNLTGYGDFGILAGNLHAILLRTSGHLHIVPQGPHQPPGAPGTPHINLIPLHLQLQALLHNHETATLVCVPPLPYGYLCGACD
jgi:hypothetical protein